MGSIPGSGRSPGGGHGNPLQYSCLENPMDRGAWRATVHGVAKSWTRLSTHIHKSPVPVQMTSPQRRTTFILNAAHGISGFPPFLEHLSLLTLGSRQVGMNPKCFREMFACRRANPCICSFFLSFEKGPQGSTGTQFENNNPTDWQNHRGGSNKADIGVTSFDDYNESQRA